MLSQKDVYEQWARVNARNKEPLLSGFRLCAELAGALATDERPHNRMLSTATLSRAGVASASQITPDPAVLEQFGQVLDETQMVLDCKG